MTIEIFIVDGEEVKINKTFLVENKRAPQVDMQELVDEAYKILDQEIRDEAQRLTQHND